MSVRFYTLHVFRHMLSRPLRRTEYPAGLDNHNFLELDNSLVGESAVEIQEEYLGEKGYMYGL